MYIYATLTVFTIVTDFVLAENKLNLMLKDPTAVEENVPKDGLQPSTTPKEKSADFPFLNSMWVYRPNSHPVSLDDNNAVVRDRVPRPGVSVTRLAKSLYYRFDPYFHRTYFEPFETRSKPVRLVALNRNGRLQRERIRMVINEASNIAELQSPFNEVGNYWLEDTIMQQ